MTNPRISQLPTRYALAIAGTYLVLGAIYIAFSDEVVARVASSVADAQRLETVKGWAFIVVTALSLFAFSRALFERLSGYEQEQSRKQDAARQLDRRALAGALASTVAHDGNNLLTVAKLEAELLRARPEPEIRDIARELDDAIDQLVEMMQRLRDLGSHTRASVAREIDLAAEVEHSVARVRKHARVRPCAVSVVTKGPLEMSAYPVLVDELVTNLVLNAAEASTTPCRIEVEVAPAEGGAHIAVSDDGPGIPDPLREKVFEPFFTTKSEGTGLGLLSVRACADAHGGNVTIEKSPLGGARFVVTLRSVSADRPRS